MTINVTNGIGRNRFIEVAEDRANWAETLKTSTPAFQMSFLGKKIVRYDNKAVVEGSNDRPQNAVLPVYLAEGRKKFTLRPVGEPVGALIRGGYCGQSCHVGLFEEVKPAPHH
jgi:hypothetical protein